MVDKVEKSERIEKGDNEIITLQQMSKTRYFRKLVQFKAMITGKAVLPYQVPKEITIGCKMKRTCKSCYVAKNWNEQQNLCSIKFRPEDPLLLRFINTADTHFPGILKSMYEIDSRCSFKMNIKSVYMMDEVYMTDIIQERGYSTSGSSVMRIGYVVNQTLESNTSYILTGYVVPEPKTQKIMCVITDTKKLKTDVDSFVLSRDAITTLDVFNEDISSKTSPTVGETDEKDEQSVEGIFTFLHKIYDVYAANITQIFKRFDLHMAIDLVFHSPLQFHFNNEFVHKGWLDVMVIGDTRCGKGYVSENLIKYYGFGDIVSGENASFAGLVGGVQQLNGRWVVTWGKIPLNNRRMVVIDESGEMDPKDFSRLSRIRSEGIAEVTKIHAERTQAMTRLLFLTNPKNRMISSYSFGIEAITDLIESAEDISRFDYVLVVSQNEVNINEINKERVHIKNDFAEADPMLIQWIWSRKPDQIQFSRETTDLILNYAIKLGGIYSPKIPLVQGENIRIKLAKISASIAGRLFSRDKTGQILVVRPIHVKAAYVFINMIYKKASSGYYYYSQIQNQAAIMRDQKEFESYVQQFENKLDLVSYFVNNNYINLNDLSEALNQPREIAREVISKLIHHQCIQKKYTFYVKTQSFTTWLKNNR
jgi:hypothetical protein